MIIGFMVLLEGNDFVNGEKCLLQVSFFKMVLKRFCNAHKLSKGWVQEWPKMALLNNKLE